MDMDLAIETFESIGANCEFGFFQRDMGNETSGLFRWAEIPKPELLIATLDREFTGMFELDNLRPFNAGMVLDVATGIGWHSAIRSELIDPALPPVPENFRFVTPEAERARIQRDQQSKIQYMAEKTIAALNNNEKIFVFKPLKANLDFSIDDGSRIFDAMARLGSRRLMVVTAGDVGRTPGTIIEVKPGLVHGVIDRFAPGSNAHDISATCWTALCCQAAEVLN